MPIFCYWLKTIQLITSSFTITSHLFASTHSSGSQLISVFIEVTTRSRSACVHVSLTHQKIVEVVFSHWKRFILSRHLNCMFCCCGCKSSQMLNIFSVFISLLRMTQSGTYSTNIIIRHNILGIILTTSDFCDI